MAQQWTGARRRNYAYASGVSRLRRLLRRLPEELTDGIKTAIREGAEAIHHDALTMVPKDTGNLAAGIDYRISRDGFSADVGIVTGKGKRRMRLRRSLFYGHFVERGTKGSPDHNIPPQPARPFLQPAFDMNRDWIMGRLSQAITRALNEAASGSADTINTSRGRITIND